MLKLKLLFLFFITIFSSFSQIDEYKRITSVLCSSDFHGRGYVKKGDSVAADFIKREFQRIGLKPRKKDFLQAFNLGVNTFPNKMFVQVENEILTPGKDFILAPESGSYKGKIFPKELSVEQFLNEERLVIAIKEALSNNGSSNAILYNSVGVQSDTNNRVHTIIQQVLSFVPVIEIVDAKFMWSVGREQFNNPYIKIQSNVKLNKSILVDIDAKYEGNYSSQNVIGYLPSKKWNAETIVVTAHYDHLGRLGHNTYFPGANDNASGIAMMLLIAEYFKENKVDKHILFIAFGGEEAGLIGSQYFVNNPTFPLRKIDFVLNIDILGSGNEGITVVNSIEQELAFQLLNNINSEKKLVYNIKKRGQTSNSDHYWFSQKGIPAIFIYTRGSNKNYHDINDLYENLFFDEVEDLKELFTSFIRLY
jgi:aminopeptidase YwaD